MALGLEDSVINRSLAERQAEAIERDLQSDRVVPGSFDPTLARYRETTGESGVSVVDLFDKYTEHKRKTLSDSRSLEKYLGLRGHLQRFFKARSAQALSEAKAFEFRDWLLKSLKPVTVRERLGMLRSCWGWGAKRKLVGENPWADVRVKVPAKGRSRPFTGAEIQKILGCCKEKPQYQHWADFIEFCLSVGCRPGEAAGLKWCHLADDCSSVWISESWGRGRQKGTKTNQARAFGLFPELQAMLLERKQPGCKSEDYIFTAPRGGQIDDHNFRRRVWTPLLAELNIPYRKPYNTRHTFSSHAIDQGYSVSEVAAITGNSEETILRNYVGNPHGKVSVRRLF